MEFLVKFVIRFKAEKLRSTYADVDGRYMIKIKDRNNFGGFYIFVSSIIRSRVEKLGRWQKSTVTQYVNRTRRPEAKLFF